MAPITAWLGDQHAARLAGIASGSGRVLELGGGGSTSMMLQHMGKTAQLVCVETSPAWRDTIREAVGSDDRLTLLEDESQVPEGHYDLVFIDSPSVQDRVRHLQMSHRWVRAGGLVVLHDAQIPIYRDEKSLWDTVEETLDPTFSGSSETTLWIGSSRDTISLPPSEP